MLVLSRKADQKVKIKVPPSSTPTEIDVVLVDIRGDKSRLGFEAPLDVAIHREEVARRIAAEAEGKEEP